MDTIHYYFISHVTSRNIIRMLNIIPLWNVTNKYKDLVAQDMYNI